MRFTTAVFALAAFASTALAHMEMIDPPPFRSKANTLIDPSTFDFNMNAPLAPDGSNFPCKGYQGDLNQSPAGDTNTTWAAGSAQKVTLADSAQHNGGSCQLSISYDGGKTFRVIKSIEGNCVNPTETTQSFDFNVPAEAKSGKVIFAWTWFNHTGNREMYMNCAAVNISGAGTSTLDDRPEIFTANIGGACKTVEGFDTVFPDPGPDLDVLSTASLGPPVCSGSSSESATPTTPADSATATPTEPADSANSTDSPAAVDTGSTSCPNMTDTTDSSSTAPTDSNGALVPVPTGTDTTSAPTTVPDDSSPTAPTAAPTDGSSPTYTVKAGDICVDIAKQQGVDLSTLFTLNPTVNKACTNLEIGQTLRLRVPSRIMRDLY